MPQVATTAARWRWAEWGGRRGGAGRRGVDLGSGVKMAGCRVDLGGGGGVGGNGGQVAGAG